MFDANLGLMSERRKFNIFTSDLILAAISAPEVSKAYLGSILNLAIGAAVRRLIRNGLGFSSIYYVLECNI